MAEDAKIVGDNIEKVRREVAIRRKHAPYTDQDGNMTGETYSNFLTELEELSNMDVEIPDMERIEMPVSDMTVREMEALDGFIDLCLQKHEVI